MNIRLHPMTKTLCRSYMQLFVPDPALFADPKSYRPYVYSESSCDAYYERHQKLGRIHLAIMMNQIAIGEIIFKNIDREHKHCTLSISMQCDQYKNQGYGTQAEILALDYAFSEMKMEAVYADALLGNTRSQHVLEKVGFTETHRDDTFVYYKCPKASWSSKNDQQI